MDIFYRTADPTYVGCKPPPTQTGSGILSGLWCRLLGAAVQPPYKETNFVSNARVASRSWWHGCPATPQYKPRPKPAPEDCGSEPTVPEPVDAEPPCPPCEETEVFDSEPPEVYVW